MVTAPDAAVLGARAGSVMCVEGAGRVGDDDAWAWIWSCGWPCCCCVDCALVSACWGDAQQRKSTRWANKRTGSEYLGRGVIGLVPGADGVVEDPWACDWVCCCVFCCGGGAVNITWTEIIKSKQREMHTKKYIPLCPALQPLRQQKNALGMARVLFLRWCEIESGRARTGGR